MAPTPLAALPAIKFAGGSPALTIVPPIRLFVAAVANTPSPPLPSNFVPVISVPMKFVCTWLFCAATAAPPPRLTPCRPFAEITLRAAIVIPPIMFDDP